MVAQNCKPQLPFEGKILWLHCLCS